MNEKNPDAPLELSIGKTAELFGISPFTLRYYEKEGLITPPRTNSKYRKYSWVDFLELTDIVFLRNLNIPVKTVKELFHAPVEETYAELEKASAVLEDQIASAESKLSEIAFYKREIETYKHLKMNNYTLVNVQSFDPIVLDKVVYDKPTTDFIQHPYTTNYVCVNKSILEPSNFQPGLVVDKNTLDKFNPEEILWNPADVDQEYLHCLTKTTYADFSENNLLEHYEYMKEHSYIPGIAISELLVTETDQDTGIKYEFYDTWIQVLSPTQK